MSEEAAQADTEVVVGALATSIPYDMRKRKKRPQWCANCGKHGHNSKQCQFPVISCGVILFRRVPTNDAKSGCAMESHNIDYFHLAGGGRLDSGLQASQNTSVEYLLVRRKDSLNFVEFVRGKYDPLDTKFLFQAFNEMSVEERAKIAVSEFSTLWKNLWMSSYSNISHGEFSCAEHKFNNLKKGYVSYDGKFVSIEVLLKETTGRYVSPEWGFPKGKRNRRETDYECAKREFTEETGCQPGDYCVLHQLDSIAETFKGSNDVMYKHIYFVARHRPGAFIQTVLSDPEQLAEIGQVGWYDAKQAIELFRPYDVEKRTLLMRLDNVLNNCYLKEELKVQALMPQGPDVAVDNAIADTLS